MAPYFHSTASQINVQIYTEEFHILLWEVSLDQSYYPFIDFPHELWQEKMQINKNRKLEKTINLYITWKKGKCKRDFFSCYVSNMLCILKSPTGSWKFKKKKKKSAHVDT